MVSASIGRLRPCSTTFRIPDFHESDGGASRSDEAVKPGQPVISGECGIVKLLPSPQGDWTLEVAD
jgi:hypothetical protein